MTNEQMDCLNLLREKTHSDDLCSLTLGAFRELPLYVEGESKEIRILNHTYGIIYFKPTIYSFTSNRTGIVEGSNVPRVKVSQVLCELLKENGIDHSYVLYGNEFVITRLVENAPNIEVVVKANHTGTSKHRYFGMGGSRVRMSHPVYWAMPIFDMEPYPAPIVRFDWRNPFQHPVTGVQLADEIMCDDQADLYIDVKEAKRTASKAFQVLSDFLVSKDIVIYDLCLFISEDGKTVFGEISPDCGRYRHFNLGSLDKDVWRAGGSSSEVLLKWNLLYEMITKDE
jgi:phosphoribosylaminoimidazole-succinocarboxamide synthase